MVHNTVTGNSATSRGGGLYARLYEDTNGLTVANNIIWGNNALVEAGDVYLADDENTNGIGSVVNLYNNDYTSLVFTDGDNLSFSGNINLDPRLTADFHLLPISPCRDKALNTYLTRLDMDGELRFRGATGDMGADEYSNNSFENGAALPILWRGSNLTELDRRVGKVFHAGTRSFRFIGGPADKSLRQIITHGGAAGERLALGAWSKAAGTNPKGGAYRIEAKVVHADKSVKRYRAGFAKASHPWQYREVTFTTEQAYTKIIVYLRYARQTGRAFFDEVMLTGE